MRQVGVNTVGLYNLVQMTDAERRTWHDTALGLHDLQRVANSAAEAVNTLATQLT